MVDHFQKICLWARVWGKYTVWAIPQPIYVRSRPARRGAAVAVEPGESGARVIVGGDQRRKVGLGAMRPTKAIS